MSAKDAHPAATRHALRAALLRNGAVWLALIGLLGLSTGIAFLPWGNWAFAAEILISAMAAGTVGVVSMSLDRSPVLDRLAAAAGFLFIVVMFTMAACDIYNRL